MVPRSTVLTSLAARMMEFVRRAPAAPGAPPFSPPRSDLVVAAAADAGVPSPTSFEHAVRTRAVAATITAGERRSDAIDTSDVSRDQREGGAVTGRVGGNGTGSPRARARSAAAM